MKADRRQRRAALFFGLGMTILAVLLGLLAWDSLARLVFAWRGAAHRMTIDSGAVLMAALTPILFGFAALGFAFMRERRNPRFEKMVLGSAIVILPLGLAAPFAFDAWMSSALTARGYTACPNEGRPTRFPRRDWVDNPSICAQPADGRR